jgi:hypothetical protein
MPFRKCGQGEVLPADGQPDVEPESSTPPIRTAHLREADERFYSEEEALKASNPDRG